MYKTVMSVFMAVASFSTVNLSSAQQTVYSEDYLPMDQHVVTSKAVDGSTFEIEDKSQWKVYSADRQKVSAWTNGDLLKLYPNNQCFRSSKYVMVNARTKEAARVDLFLGPMAGLEHYKRIVAIDFSYGEVLVENDNGFRTAWQVPLSEMQKLASWKINHTIIVGSNNPSWFWADDVDCVLINVERGRFVQALQVE